MIHPDRLSQLRAEAGLAAAARATAESAETERIAQAREAGRRMAAEVLPWHRVVALVEALPVARGSYGPVLRWAHRRDALAPEAHSLGTAAEWRAFLEGVAEIAELVAGSSVRAVPTVRLWSEL